MIAFLLSKTGIVSVIGLGLAIMIGAVGFARHTGDRLLENYMELAGMPGGSTAIGYGSANTITMS